MRKKKEVKWHPIPRTKCYISNNWRKLHGYPMGRKGYYSCIEINGVNKCGLPFC